MSNKNSRYQKMLRRAAHKSKMPAYTMITKWDEYFDRYGILRYRKEIVPLMPKVNLNSLGKE